MRKSDQSWQVVKTSTVKAKTTQQEYENKSWALAPRMPKKCGEDRNK